MQSNGMNNSNGIGPDERAQAKTAAIAVQGLHVRLGQAHILHGVDVCMARGRWTAIAGPNGAGKSTLLRALAGLLPHDAHAASEAPSPMPQAGQVQWWGTPLQQLTPRQRARRMAWLGQNEEAAPDLRVWDVVMLGRLPHQGWLALPSHTDMQAVEQALHTMRAWAWRDRLLGQLSGGERQRVAIARAVFMRPRVLLADEPTGNLDEVTGAQVGALMNELNRELGMTLVVVTHNRELAAGMGRTLELKAGTLYEKNFE